MTFMHMDTTTAAAAVGTIVGWPWNDDAPYSNINIHAGGDGFDGRAEFRLGGEGHVTYEGSYELLEDTFVTGTGDWIDPTKLAQQPNYFFRSIDIVDYGVDKGSEPGTPIYYAGIWTGGRTDWRSFAIVSPHGNIVSDVFAEWQCDAAGEFGEPYIEEDWDGVIEIGSLGALSVTFEPADVIFGVNEFDITDHGFITGDQALLTVGTGDLPTPLVTNTAYAIRRISSSRFSIGNALLNIDATPSYIGLTDAGTGSGHTFQRIDAVASAVLSMSASI